jgi:pyridoxal phosphate enzyme (YggS family)
MERIERAAERSGRRADEIKLVAVTKTHPAKTLREALELGLKTFGENRVQEAEEKIDEIGRDKAEWHLIGHLQKNKVRKAVKYFDAIHSIDSVEICHRLEAVCAEEGRGILPVLIQLNIGKEASKSGAKETELQLIVETLKRCEHLHLAGLMCLPPFSEDPEQTRPYFARLRGIRDRLAHEGTFGRGIGELSMGMSHDFETAIEEGATVVRVGTAIFGMREAK